MRYVPMTPELAEASLRRVPAVIAEDRIFPPKPWATGELGSEWKEASRISSKEPTSKTSVFVTTSATRVRFVVHEMNGGDLYELAKILGHSNIKMTERYVRSWQSTTSRRPAARLGKSGN